MAVTTFRNNLNNLVNVIRNKGEITQIIRRINTGYYKYFVIVSYSEEYGLRYRVNKKFTNGTDLGTTVITKVNKRKVECEGGLTVTIPESASRAIIEHYIELINALGVKDI